MPAEISPCKGALWACLDPVVCSESLKARHLIFSGDAINRNEQVILHWSVGYPISLHMFILKKKKEGGNLKFTADGFLWSASPCPPSKDPFK